VPDTLTIEDIDDMATSAETASHPLTIAADLVDAVDRDRLADPADVSYALLAAAEIFEAEDDIDRATELARRATRAEGADPTDRHAAQATYGRLLIAKGRDDEGMAELAELRPALLTDAELVEHLADVLLELDRSELAHEWLTDAIEQKKAEIAAAADAEGVEHVEVFYQLISVRHDVRHELDLPHDGYDELAEKMTSEMAASANDDDDDDDDDESILVFWPQAEFERLLQRWPTLAEYVGPDWDEHRGLVERSLNELSASSAVPPALTGGSVDGLIEFAGELDLDMVDPNEGHDPSDPLVMMGYVESLEGPLVEWPPGRNDNCWCGSGLKYKKCCLPRARA
jgi:hypothetical protein